MQKKLCWRFLAVLVSVVGLAGGRSIVPIPQFPAMRQQLVGSWEQGSCDSQGIMCSQMRLQFLANGRATWDGYPEFHGTAQYLILAVDGNRLIVQFTKPTGNIGPDPFTTRFEVQPTTQSLIELEHTTRGTTFPRNLTWHRGAP